MKIPLSILGTLLIILVIGIQSEETFAETNASSSTMITVTFVGSYEEIAIQTQQLAQMGDSTPTWLNVGPTRLVENWLNHANTTPGIDGRLGHFTPPTQIRRDGCIWKLDGPLGDPTISDVEQTHRLTEVPLALAVGAPPEDYVWTGDVRQKTSSEVVSWVQDWRYVWLRNIEGD